MQYCNIFFDKGIHWSIKKSLFSSFAIDPYKNHIGNGVYFGILTKGWKNKLNFDYLKAIDVHHENKFLDLEQGIKLSVYTVNIKFDTTVNIEI